MKVVALCKHAGAKGVNSMKFVMPKVRRWTRQEYERFVEMGIFAPDERVELINGKVVEMAPQTSRHATAVTLVSRALSNVFGEGYVMRVQLPLAATAASEPEPDVAIVRGSPRDYLQAHPTSAVLVVEVSDTTLEYDRTTKAAIYAEAKVEEYWIVNLVNECVEVYREPAPMPERPMGYGYKLRRIYLRGESITPLATQEKAISVDDILP